MKINLFVIMIFGLFSCNAQLSNKAHSEKIDSVFNYYFSLFDLEISRTIINENNKHLYQVIILDINENNKHLYQELNLQSDTVYMLRDLPQAAEFLSKLSGIKIPYSDKSEEMHLTKEIVDSWKKWFIENRQKLYWSKKKNEPMLKK